MADTDLLLRHQVRLEGLSHSHRSRILRDVRTTVDTVKDRIESTLNESDLFEHSRLTRLRGNLVSLRQSLSDNIATVTNETLEVTFETTKSSLVSGGFIDDVPAASYLTTIGNRQTDGRTWARWGRKLADDTMDRIESELRQATLTGEAIPEISQRMQNVLKLSDNAATRLARTSVNDVANLTRMEMINEFAGDLVTGWQYVAFLDGRTSLICQGLDGQIFKKDDPQLPRPPRHPNCRSVLIPVTQASSEIQKEAGPGLRASKDGPVKADLTYPDWLKRQPTEFQREVLGPTRFKAFKNGVPIGDMATYDRPLSIAELKRLYPDKVNEAA